MDANQLFQSRAAKNQSEVARYAKFIFNGHFIVFLTIAIGALLLQYSRMLDHLPGGINYHLIIAVVLAALCVPALRTFFKAADSVFLLPYEKQMQPYIKRAILRSGLTRTALFVPLFALFIPLYLAGNQSLVGLSVAFVFAIISIFLGLYIRWYGLTIGITNAALSLLLFLMVTAGVYNAFEGVIYVAIVEVVFMALLLLLLKNIAKERVFPWDTLIPYEEDLTQRQYKTINMFTDVKGLKDNVRRRRYLDGLLKQPASRFNQQGMFLYLFKRNFARSKDAFWLIIRLIAIGSVLIWLINQPIVAAIIGIFTVYIIILQSSQFYKQQAYQLWPQVWPVHEDLVIKGFQQFLWQLSLAVTIIISLIFIAIYPAEFYYAALFFVIMWWTNQQVMGKLKKKMTLLKD